MVLLCSWFLLVDKVNRITHQVFLLMLAVRKPDSNMCSEWNRKAQSKPALIKQGSGWLL